jgi:hypothetical protein
MNNESIYDERRLALPDEVWNFRRGDGIEKALLLADFLIHKNPVETVSIEIDNKNVSLKHGKKEFVFTSEKKLKKNIVITGYKYEIN